MAMHKVLIPLDGSEFSRQAVPLVRHLFSPADYQVILLRAADEPVGVMAAPPRDVVVGTMFIPAYRSELDAERAKHPIYASQACETKVAALKDELREEARLLQYAGYQVSLEVRLGDPVEEIAACVQDQAVDIVVMATHGRSGLKRFVLGSVAEQVLRNLDIPVMLVRPV